MEAAFQLGDSTSTYYDEYESVNSLRYRGLTDAPAQAVAQAMSRADHNAGGVSYRVLSTAIELLRLMNKFGVGVPDITLETTGEISLEWYKDKQHLLVLTVDGQNLMWLAMAGPGRPASGTQSFDAAMPQEVLAAIDAVI
jgi:hypothetical protein